MQKKLLIDLIKCRNCPECKVDCSHYHHSNNNGLKSLRELAVFRYTCRKCEDAPCIQVCPSAALEKDDTGTIQRAINLCVACKSCVSICPFGTLMNDFFDYKSSVCYLCFSETNEIHPECIESCEQKAIEFTEMEENTEEHIYALNDYVLVKEYCWDKLKNEPFEAYK